MTGNGKKICREVEGFDETVWNRLKEKLLTNILEHKFRSHKQEKLLKYYKLSKYKIRVNTNQGKYIY